MKNLSKINLVQDALHGMAYYIFLKSLRSLEEFRKNPHVKIPLKSPCANFQSLGKFRNPIFKSEILFPCFRPGRPRGPLGHWPSRPRWPLSSPGPNSTLPAQLARVSMAYLRKYIFPFGFAPSELAASFSSLCQVGLGCQIHLPPPPADHCHFLSSPPATPHRPISDLEMPGEVFIPRLDSPP
jgi:hypothetical protein